MARDHARLLVRLNADRDFAELDPVAQWLFHRLPARLEISWAGVLPLDPRRWAKMSRRATVEDIEKAVATLAAGRYLIVDEDTDEVLVRSLIRNDGVAKQPNVLRAALRSAEHVASPLLRHELAVELRRVRSDAKEWQREEIDAVIAALDPDYPGEGFAHPSVNPSRNPSADSSSNPSANPPANPPSNPPANPPANPGNRSPERGSVEPFPKPQGEGEGVGEGESPWVGGDFGGSRARAREAASRPSASGGPPPPPTPSQIERDPPDRWPEQPCGEAHDRTRNCWRCAAARQAADRGVLAETAERAEAARRRRECPACDDAGWLEHPETGAPVARCDHETDARQQLAAALDEPS